MNSVNLIGRLVERPEIKTTGNSKFAYGSIAVRRDFKDANGEYGTDFIPYRVWGNLADVIFRQEKGALIALNGSWRRDTYKAQDGTNKEFNHLNVEKITLLEFKKEEKKEAKETKEDDFDFFGI